MTTKVSNSKCGSCLHFKAHAKFEKVCSKLGTKAHAVAPSRCYTPDATAIVTNSDELRLITSLFDSFDAKQRQIFKSMLERSGRKKKFSFGQIVYFKAASANYISNYLKGTVLGYTTNGEVVISGDPDKNTRGKSYTALMDEGSLMTLREWNKIRKSLIDQGLVEDPKKPVFKRIRIEVDHNPPTMDNAPQHFFTKEKEFVGSAKRQKKVVEHKTIVIQG